jgi:phospholipase/lecithinase/hemolysin
MFTSTLTRRLVLTVGLALVLAAPRPSAAQSPYSGIVVFGTSLSDPGNAFALTGTQGLPPDFTLSFLNVPSAPYAKGGHHFSDGATWIEQYARTINLADSVKAAFATTDPRVSNYAVGGARARAVGGVPLPTQVGAFLSRTGGVAPSSALYVIEMGGNDLRDALTASLMNQDPFAVLDDAVASIDANIRILHDKGAREFLVWTAPNIGTAPAILMLGAQASAGATQLSGYFNYKLQLKLATLRTQLADGYFGVFDSFSIVNGIISDKDSYGLTNVNTACVALNEPFTCQNPGDFLFWDGIHPTKAGHAILAQKAADIIR